MNFRYRIDSAARIGEVTCFDTFTVEDMIEATLRMSDDGLWRPGFGELWDGTGITDLRVVPSDMKRLNAIDRQVASRIGATALVTTSFAARMLADTYLRLFGLGRPARVFGDLDAARTWLRTQVAAPARTSEWMHPTNP